MKKSMWGYKKVDTVLIEVISKSIYKGANQNKARRRRLLGMKIKEKRPVGGYPVYWVRRSRPNYTINSESHLEDNKHFLADEFGD